MVFFKDRRDRGHLHYHVLRDESYFFLIQDSINE